MWPGKTTRGISSAPIFAAQLLRRGSPSSWAGPTISRLRRTATKRQLSSTQMHSIRRWSQLCSPGLQEDRHSAGESSRPAERFRASAPSARPVPGRFAKHPDPHGGQKPLNSTPLLSSPALNRCLLQKQMQHNRPIRRAAAEAVENASVAVAAGAVVTTIRGTHASPGNPAGNRTQPRGRAGTRSEAGLALRQTDQSAKRQPLLPKLTMGDWYARTRTIKLHQTPERTHAPAKTEH